MVLGCADPARKLFTFTLKGGVVGPNVVQHFSPDAKRLASRSHIDGTVKVWDAQEPAKNSSPSQAQGRWRQRGLQPGRQTPGEPFSDGR